MIVVPGKVVFVDEKVVISIQLPEFAVYHVKVFVTEELSYLIDVFLFFKQLNHIEKVGTTQFRYTYFTWPGPGKMDNRTENLNVYIYNTHNCIVVTMNYKKVFYKENKNTILFLLYQRMVIECRI